MSSLLPPNATAQERALDSATARIAAITTPIRELWNPALVPVAILPLLAWALSVDVWDPAWPDALKRQVVAESLEIHAAKGTPWAVRRAVQLAGYAGVEILEGLPTALYDGSEVYDGVETYSGANRWAKFRVIADLGETLGLTAADTARIRAIIAVHKNARSHLDALSYRATVQDAVPIADQQAITAQPQHADVRPAGRRYDGSIDYDQVMPLDYDGLVWFDGALTYSGVADVGARFDNVWDIPMLALHQVEDDKIALRPLYDASHRYSGAVTHGDAEPFGVDGDLDLTWLQHHDFDGRYGFDGAIQYQGTFAQQEVVL